MVSTPVIGVLSNDALLILKPRPNVHSRKLMNSKNRQEIVWLARRTHNFDLSIIPTSDLFLPQTTRNTLAKHSIETIGALINYSKNNELDESDRSAIEAALASWSFPQSKRRGDWLTVKRTIWFAPLIAVEVYGNEVLLRSYRVDREVPVIQFDRYAPTSVCLVPLSEDAPQLSSTISPNQFGAMQNARDSQCWAEGCILQSRAMGTSGPQLCEMCNVTDGQQEALDEWCIDTCEICGRTCSDGDSLCKRCSQGPPDDPFLRLGYLKQNQLNIE